MKTLTAALLASAFFTGPALACPGMSAEFGYKKSTHTAAVTEPKTEEAMTTFDPADKPLFEAITASSRFSEFS